MQKYSSPIFSALCFLAFTGLVFSELQQYSCRNTRCADIIRKASELSHTELVDTERGTILFFADNTVKERIFNLLKAFDVPAVQIKGKLRISGTGENSVRNDSLDKNHIRLQKTITSYKNNEEMNFNTLSGFPFHMNLSTDTIRQIADFYYIENRGLKAELVFHPVGQNMEADIMIKTEVNKGTEQLQFKTRLLLNPGTWTPLVLHRSAQDNKTRALRSEKSRPTKSPPVFRENSSDSFNIGVEILVLSE